jgi:histone H3/H4
MVKDFPLLPLENLARKAGAERVSLSGVKALKQALLEMSDAIARDAIAASNHAKRVTVKAEDIRLVTR